MSNAAGADGSAAEWGGYFDQYPYHNPAVVDGRHDREKVLDMRRPTVAQRSTLDLDDIEIDGRHGCRPKFCRPPETSEMIRGIQACRSLGDEQGEN